MSNFKKFLILFVSLGLSNCLCCMDEGSKSIHSASDIFNIEESKNDIDSIFEEQDEHQDFEKEEDKQQDLKEQFKEQDGQQEEKSNNMFNDIKLKCTSEHEHFDRRQYWSCISYCTPFTVVTNLSP